jgi:hypothetical protein
VIVSTVKKLVARMPDAWVRRNARQLGSGPREAGPMPASKRGGQRSGTAGPKGRTKAQPYNEAKQRGVEGRSKMNKEHLRRAVDAKK